MSQWNRREGTLDAATLEADPDLRAFLAMYYLMRNGERSGYGLGEHLAAACATAGLGALNAPDFDSYSPALQQDVVLGLLFMAMTFEELDRFDEAWPLFDLVLRDEYRDLVPEEPHRNAANSGWITTGGSDRQPVPFDTPAPAIPLIVNTQMMVVEAEPRMHARPCCVLYYLVGCAPNSKAAELRAKILEFNYTWGFPLLLMDVDDELCVFATMTAYGNPVPYDWLEDSIEMLAGVVNGLPELIGLGDD